MHKLFRTIILSFFIGLLSIGTSSHAGWHVVSGVFCDIFCDIPVAGDPELTREEALEKIRLLYERYHSLSPEEQERYLEEYNRQYLEYSRIVRGVPR